MPINQLRIERLRNLTTVVMSDLQPFNVFYGQNGSGKTSILEALHILATGRSFRTHLPKLYIQHQQKNVVIFAQTLQDKIGVQKHLSGEHVIRVNGENIATQAQLAKLLPVQHIDPQSSDILEHGAKPRRQLLDWLMFHVEQDFYHSWQQYGRVLKQRNSLLKQYRTISFTQLETWNKLLVEYGEHIHLQRTLVVEEWQHYLQQELVELLPEIKITMQYFAGFHAELGLWQDLLVHHHKDVERKNTEYGPHRADLRFKTPLGDADDVLSRGQKKMLMMALKLSQIAMLQAKNRETVVLLDDLTAELDVQAQQRLITRLIELGSQVFVTVLEPSLIQQQLDKLDLKYAMFYVEHGVVLNNIV